MAIKLNFKTLSNNVNLVIDLMNVSQKRQCLARWPRETSVVLTGNICI